MNWAGFVGAETGLEAGIRHGVVILSRLVSQTTESRSPLQQSRLESGMCEGGKMCLMFAFVGMAELYEETDVGTE